MEVTLHIKVLSLLLTPLLNPHTVASLESKVTVV